MMSERKKRVNREFLRILETIDTLVKQDIKQKKEWMWRYDAFDATPWDKMLWQIWKPVGSFFADAKCCSKKEGDKNEM